MLLFRSPKGTQGQGWTPNLSDLLWESIFSMEAVNFLALRGKYLTSPYDVLDLYSHELQITASLNITLNESGVMVVGETPVEDLWENIFSRTEPS